MKKTRITKGVVVFIFCLLVKLSLFAQSTFQKSYSTSIDDSPMQFIQTTDKGFAILGLPEDYNFEYLIKTDSLGNKIWSKEYEYNNPLGDMVNGNIIQTSDKGYLICDTHILIKTDSLGTLLWSNYYTSGSSNLLNSAIEVPGGYVVAGTTLKNNAALLMKINLSGNILWTNESFGGDALNMSWSKTDSCFYLIAVSDSAGGYQYYKD